MKVRTFRQTFSLTLILGVFSIAVSAQDRSDAGFQGKIGKSYKDSTSDFPQPVKPPKDAPNVLVVLIDDLGFAGTSAFGGLVPTPNMDKLAKNGLRYNRMHTTALCSPTRAALLSGRNHHQVGMACITELATGFPGYNSVWGQENAAIGEVLRTQGYNTAAFGKWHDTPDWETSPAGPYDRWPTGKGFNFFYGFQGGETHQYYPQLYRNNDPVEPKTTPEQGYHLTTDLADEAIAWMQKQRSVAPQQPWFLYFAPGAMHAPHHAPQAYIDKFKGKFDMGWDKFREEAFENQKKLGVIPPDTKLTPRPAEMPSWESCSADEKKVYARQMEAFAGFLSHLDDNLGRLFDAVASGEGGDNTLIICIAGDNGCSPEGGLTGTINNMATQNGFPDDFSVMLKAIDEIGGPKHENNFAVCWAWAVNTPMQWTKQVSSHFGGTRNGTIISWPAKIKDVGGVRSQFHHVTDIAPTIYEAAGITMPEKVNGVTQVPLAGVSMVYSFADAKAEDQKKTQYFEIMGNRAIYHDGWMASARHGLPWVLLGRTGDFDKDEWELYDLTKDFSQANNVAEQFPDKLKELQAVFDAEAKKYNVYPLDDRFSERAAVADRPSIMGDRTSFTYYPGATRIPEGSAPNLKARSHKITAELDIADAKTEGVIVCAGGSGGYSLFVKDGKLMYENNFFGKNRDLIQSDKPLPSGKVTVSFEYTHESKEYGGGGTGQLFINGEKTGEATFKHVVPVRYSATETFDVGADLGEAVSEQYHSPFTFTGKLEKVVIDVK